MKPNHTSLAEDARKLRRRMRSIRHELPSDVRQARTEVHNLIDWKYYVRTYPQFILPTVALAAYSLVPQSRSKAANCKVTGGSRSGSTSDRDEKRSDVDEQVQQASLISGLAGAAMTIATRSLVSMATKYGAEYLSRQFAGSDDPTSLDRQTPLHSETSPSAAASSLGENS